MRQAGQSGNVFVLESEKEGGSGEKTRAPTMANPTARPSPVQGAYGQVKIQPGLYSKPGDHCAPKRKRGAMRKVFATAEMELIARMHAAVVAYCEIDRRMPGARAGMVRSQLGALVMPGDEEGEGVVQPPPAGVTSAEVSLYDAVAALMLAYVRTDVLGAALVIGRALGRSWKSLRLEDVKRRCRAQLVFIRNNALYRMALSPEGATVLEKVDIFAVDKVDRKRR